LNKVSGSIRAMSKAHRHEVLDDYMRDSNWKKLVGIGEYFLTSLFIIIDIWYWIVKSLSKKFKAAETGIKTTKAAFEEVDDTIDDNSRLQWEEDEMLARNYRGDALKIYEVKMDKGVPTFNSKWLSQIYEI
jgi:hypothetical protein